MSNKQNLKVEEIVRSFKNRLGENLFAIISVGSLTTDYYKESWSDIDLLIVLERISLTDKMHLADLKLSLEKKYQQRFGINIITKQEATIPIMPEITLDGKTLQGLLEANVHTHRLMYCKNEKASLFVPDKKTVLAYSLSNIAMFLLRNRKTLTSHFFNATGFKEFKAAVEKEMRASFIITKLAIQYKSSYVCTGYKDIIQRAKKEFSSFDFDILIINEEIICHWESVSTKEELETILDKTDNFIESFTKLIFDQIKN